MKSAKVLAMSALLALSTLSAASASERKYDPSMPRWAVQQHEQYVRSLERDTARKAKAEQAQASAAASSSNAAPFAAAGMLAIILLAAL